MQTTITWTSVSEPKRPQPGDKVLVLQANGFIQNAVYVPGSSLKTVWQVMYGGTGIYNVTHWAEMPTNPAEQAKQAKPPEEAVGWTIETGEPAWRKQLYEFQPKDKLSLKEALQRVLTKSVNPGITLSDHPLDQGVWEVRKVMDTNGQYPPADEVANLCQEIATEEKIYFPGNPIGYQQAAELTEQAEEAERLLRLCCAHVCGHDVGDQSLQFFRSEQSSSLADAALAIQTAWDSRHGDDAPSEAVKALLRRLSQIDTELLARDLGLIEDIWRSRPGLPQRQLDGLWEIIKRLRELRPLLVAAHGGLQLEPSESKPQPDLPPKQMESWIVAVLADMYGCEARFKDVARQLYKSTGCGCSLHIKGDTVTVHTIVEGSNAEHSVSFTVTATTKPEELIEQYRQAVDSCEAFVDSCKENEKPMDDNEIVDKLLEKYRQQCQTGKQHQTAEREGRLFEAMDCVLNLDLSLLDRQITQLHKVEVDLATSTEDHETLDALSGVLNFLSRLYYLLDPSKNAHSTVNSRMELLAQSVQQRRHQRQQEELHRERLKELRSKLFHWGTEPNRTAWRESLAYVLDWLSSHERPAKPAEDVDPADLGSPWAAAAEELPDVQVDVLVAVADEHKHKFHVAYLVYEDSVYKWVSAGGEEFAEDTDFGSVEYWRYIPTEGLPKTKEDA